MLPLVHARHMLPSTAREQKRRTKERKIRKRVVNRFQLPRSQVK
jgi:hypothetical protein